MGDLDRGRERTYIGRGGRAFPGLSSQEETAHATESREANKYRGLGRHMFL